jgi:hypothetical protein
MPFGYTAMIAVDPCSAEFGPKVSDLRAKCNRHVCIFGFGVSLLRIGMRPLPLQRVRSGICQSDPYS